MEKYSNEELYDIASQDVGTEDSVHVTSNVQLFMKECNVYPGEVKIRRDYLYYLYKLWCSHAKQDQFGYLKFFQHLSRLADFKKNTGHYFVNEYNERIARVSYLEVRAFIIDDIRKDHPIDYKKDKRFKKNLKKPTF